jgi:PDZ domain-containing secreted protein
MQIFISGSISIKALDTEVTCLLDSIMADGQTVLIGDAFGVDKLVQQYLFERNYQFVTVYFSGAKVRNNIGGWQTKQISNDNNLTGKSMYQLKDVAMAQDADCGLMIWDGKSQGTKFNIENMTKLGKEISVFKRNPTTHPRLL